MPTPHNKASDLCCGCVAQYNSTDADGRELGCSKAPDCTDRTIFILDTDEALAKYVVLRMNGGQP
jgi:hypothetical protein